MLKVSAVRQGWFDGAQRKVVRSGAGFPKHAEVRSGDLLLTRANTRELVGSACIVEDAPPGTYLSDKTLRLVPSPDRISAQYLVEALQSSSCRRQLSGAASGTSASMKNVSQDAIRSIRIPLLPIHEQQSVVRLLADVRVFQRRAIAFEATARAARDALVKTLLSPGHAIPDSYDRFLDAAS